MEENEIQNETAEPAPVIEKVSLADINEEKENEKFEEAAEIINAFMNLSPEERQAVREELLK